MSDTEEQDEVGPIGSPSSNDLVRGNLLKNGDIGEGPREISHFVYPLEDADPRSLEEVGGWLKDTGFRVEKLEEEGLAFHHDFDPFDNNFDEITGQIASSMGHFGWHYEGWETWILRKENPQ